MSPHDHGTSNSNRKATLPSLPDVGCVHHRPSCFTCPFETCLYDLPVAPNVSAPRRKIGDARRAAAAELAASGMSAPAIAKQLGIAVRTVWRYRSETPA